jgi:hypothetical protein
VLAKTPGFKSFILTGLCACSLWPLFLCHLPEIPFLSLLQKIQAMVNNISGHGLK